MQNSRYSSGPSGSNLNISGGPSGVMKYRRQSSGASNNRGDFSNQSGPSFRPVPSHPPSGFSMDAADGPGRRLRKNVANVRRHVDYVSTVLNYAETRLWQYGSRRPAQQPDELYQSTALPAKCTPEVPVDCILAKFVRAAMNKVKCPVYSLCWSPEGKRLITGASTGEFTLWNGTAFNFETILQAHDEAIRAMTWSHDGQWLVSADQKGYVKYWQPNMNNVHMFAAHKDDAIRGLAFSPTDIKLATASDDGTAKIWDFSRYSEERRLQGHGSEVRTIDWHPMKGLIATGSRDSQQPVKLWDPKSPDCLATFQDHKSSVMAVEWNRNGNWLLTAGRDHLIKLYDIRMMREMSTFRGHKKEVISIAWHPVHESLFVSGGGDGSIVYWLATNDKEVGYLEHAHDQAIWTMRWHPMGHILATGSNDNNTKFWARNRPGDTQEDIFGLTASTTNMVGALDKEREPKVSMAKGLDDGVISAPIIPGMGLADDIFEQMNRDIAPASILATAPNLLVPDDISVQKQGSSHFGAKKTLIKQPPPKKAQRQFERMWNVTKPGSEETSEDANASGPTQQRMKPSLLGKAPAPNNNGGSFQNNPQQSSQGQRQGMKKPPLPPAGRGVPMHMPPGFPPNWTPDQGLPPALAAANAAKQAALFGVSPANLAASLLLNQSLLGLTPQLIPGTNQLRPPPGLNFGLPLQNQAQDAQLHQQMMQIATSIASSSAQQQQQQHQQQQIQQHQDEGGDIDYRNMESSSSMQSSMQQPSSSMAQSSGDIDFRQQIVSQSAQAQAQQNRPMDPRMRRQQQPNQQMQQQVQNEDPRMRGAHQNHQENIPQQQQQQQRGWMPQVFNGNEQNEYRNFGDQDNRKKGGGGDPRRGGTRGRGRGRPTPY
ncbi:hypothetical protein WR25_02429 [Diploscapter pachys]|uniref:IFT140 first beta-propeller domain-containing protein n=1 Tax=Diploscapter pachys TaxID=2018661 RepID=A0A2A2KKU3_9BILA|nr:hypothetical protein WR25_02429 [Diploscapter pachys]